MVSRVQFAFVLTLGCWLSQPAATQDSPTAVDSGGETLLPEPVEPALPESAAAVDDKPPTFLKKDWQAPAEPPPSRSTMQCTETADEDGTLITHCKPVPAPDQD